MLKTMKIMSSCGINQQQKGSYQKNPSFGTLNVKEFENLTYEKALKMLEVDHNKIDECFIENVGKGIEKAQKLFAKDRKRAVKLSQIKVVEGVGSGRLVTAKVTAKGNSQNKCEYGDSMHDIKGWDSMVNNIENYVLDAICDAYKSMQKHLGKTI